MKMYQNGEGRGRFFTSESLTQLILAHIGMKKEKSQQDPYVKLNKQMKKPPLKLTLHYTTAKNSFLWGKTETVYFEIVNWQGTTQRDHPLSLPLVFFKYFATFFCSIRFFPSSY